jgi:hypothetical protein
MLHVQALILNFDTTVGNKVNDKTDTDAKHKIL